MLFLLFFVLLIQFITHWIFEPLVSFIEYVIEIRSLPILAITVFIFLFSGTRKLDKIK